MIGSGDDVAGSRQFFGQKDGLRAAAAPAVRKQDEWILLPSRRRSVERHGTYGAKRVGMRRFFVRRRIPHCHLWSTGDLYNPEADTDGACILTRRAACGDHKHE